MPALPEAPTQTRDDRARHDGSTDESGDVVLVVHGAAACGARGKDMTRQADHKQYCTEPNATATCDAGVVGRFHSTSDDRGTGLGGGDEASPKPDLPAHRGNSCTDVLDARRDCRLNARGEEHPLGRPVNAPRAEKHDKHGGDFSGFEVGLRPRRHTVLHG